MRPRRSHRKSRKGCLRCKARHIKCDESTPSCLNCTTIDLPCAYRTATPPSTPQFDDWLLSTASGSSEAYSAIQSPNMEGSSGANPDYATPSSRHSTDEYPISSGTPNTTSSDAYSPKDSSHSVQADMLQLELLHHMSSVTCKEFHFDGDKARQALDMAINMALKAPFLMYELLAVSALHLSTLRPDQESFYSSQATKLQNQAMTLFNNLPPTYTPTNPIPVFMFSSFLGLHVLFDTLRFRPDDFSLFLDRFVGYLRLHRGVTTLARGAWPALQRSELSPLLSKVDDTNRELDEGNECAELKLLMQSADLSRPSVEACSQAITLLQWGFDRSKTQAGRPENDGDPRLIFAWPITIPLEFTELLLQRKPEALAILAHYGVLLHSRMDLWIIKDDGKFLIQTIVRYLGSYWEKWLHLPINILREKM